MNWKGKVRNMEQTLKSLVGEYGEVMDMLNDPEVDEQTIIDTLEGIEGEIEVKADRYATVLRGIEFEKASLKGKKEYLKKLIDEISMQEKRLNYHEEGMKERLLEAMIATGKDETGIKTKSFEFKVKSVGGAQKLEKFGEVPQEFKRVILEDDDAKIKEYLKENTCDWARLLPRKKYVDIKGV